MQALEDNPLATENCQFRASLKYAESFIEYRDANAAKATYLRKQFVKTYLVDRGREEWGAFHRGYIKIIDVDYSEQAAIEAQRLVKVRNKAREKIQQQLDTLADKWERETRNMSSPRAIARHSATDEIVKLGSDVIPMILRRMADRPWFWFDVLKRLTKESSDPVKPDMRGDMQRMTEAWIAWGVDRGVI